MSQQYVERFWSKVDKTNSCWEWTAYTRNGYGQFRLNKKTKFAHRIAYELIKGKIPIGLVIDHLCRNTSCVNPEHLEAVPQKENVKRGLTGKNRGLQQKSKTHCPQGHEYSKENTYVWKNEGRKCRICINQRKKQHYKKLNSYGDTL